jgi:hypothetical protein
MEPTNAELARQIETVAQTVAKIYEQMATKEDMNKRFDAVEQRLTASKKATATASKRLSATSPSSRRKGRQSAALRRYTPPLVTEGLCVCESP